MKKISVLEKADILKKAGIKEYLKETQILISFVTDNPFSKIIGEKDFFLNYSQFEKFENLLNRRAKREPLQYILGYCWFWDYKFKVNKSVLIPRPETEHIIEEVLKIFPEKFNGKILDCCTGSGCVGLTLSKEYKNAEVYLSDISIDALKVAKKNKDDLNCENVEIIHCDLLNGIKTNSFDLITANPPYIGLFEKKGLQKEVLNYEPEIALFSEESGLFLITKLLNESQYILKKDGYLIFEFGIGQHEFILNYVKENLSDSFSCCYTVKDLAGIERLGVFRRA